MKKEIEFVRSATRKLRYKGDVAEEEATYIFFLGSAIYAYELGQHFERQYLNNFNFKFNYSELSQALGEWYKEVRSWIPDAFSFHNFVTTIPSIPSPDLYPPPMNSPKTTPYAMKAIREIWKEKGFILEENLKTKSRFYTSKETTEWLRKNVPLSFDVLYYAHGYVQLARYGVLGLLPVYEREVEQERLWGLSERHIPFVQSVKSRQMLHREYYSIACPIEYKDVVDAIADDQPVPKIQQVETKTRTPKDVAYIEYLTSRLYSSGDISLEEADNLYLLFKTYQVLQTMASRTKTSLQQKVKDTTKPGLNALRSWYQAVEKTLKKNRSGNFVYTLPNNTDMNLYQIGAPIKRCLQTLPEEPTEVVVRYRDGFDVKDTCLDTRRATTKVGSDEYVYYASSRYGFFKRNGIDLNPWKTIAKCEGNAWEDIFENDRENMTLGKLHFAESSGIQCIIINNAVAVKEKDRKKALEILSLPNSKILQAAELAVQKDLEEVQDELAKNPNDEMLVHKEKMLRTMNADNMALEYITKGVAMVYKAQKDQEEYLENIEWMEIDR